MRVLMIGGAGHVASLVRASLEAAHDVRYFDIKPVPGAEDRSIVADVQDEAALADAMRNVDIVIWAAMGVKPGTHKDSHDLDACFDVNVKGLYRTVTAAGKAGVRRIVYFSSMSVFQHFASPNHVPIRHDTPADAHGRYGIAKRLGECIGDVFAMHYPDATFLSLRLVKPCTAAEYEKMKFRTGDLLCALAPNDMNRLIHAALRFDRPGAYHLNTTGDLEGQAYPNEEVEDLLGWKPEGN